MVPIEFTTCYSSICRTLGLSSKLTFKIYFLICVHCLNSITIMIYTFRDDIQQEIVLILVFQYLSDNTHGYGSS